LVDRAGQEVFEAALQNPNSMADAVPEDAKVDFMFELQDMLCVGNDPWMKKTGFEMEAFDSLPALGEFEWNGEGGDIDPEKATRICPEY
jgi:hypothetical protein